MLPVLFGLRLRFFVVYLRVSTTTTYLVLVLHKKYRREAGKKEGRFGYGHLMEFDCM